MGESVDLFLDTEYDALSPVFPEEEFQSDSPWMPSKQLGHSQLDESSTAIGSADSISWTECEKKNASNWFLIWCEKYILKVLDVYFL